MHPLLKRILIRGTLVFVALSVFAYSIGAGVRRYLSSDTVSIEWDPKWAVLDAMRFGLVGVALLAFLEWLAYLRERRQPKPPVS